MELWDIAPEVHWQEMLDRISDAFGIHTMLTDADGKILLNGGFYNPLCARVRAKTESLTFVCSQSQRRIFRQAAQQGGPVSDFCEIGLFKTVVPVSVGGVLLGGLSACGVAVAGEPVEEFLLAKALDIDESEADRLTKRVSVLTSADVEQIPERFERWLNDRIALPPGKRKDAR